MRNITIIIVLTLMVVILFTIVFILKNRNARLLDSIQKMIDEANDGSLKNVRYDESQLSAIENSVIRFLQDTAVSEQKLLKQKQSIESLIADISHQTVTPLANILLYAQLLSEKYGDSKEISAVHYEADRLDFLIQSLIKMSRLENGLIQPTTKRQSVTPLLKMLGAQFEKKAEEKSIDISYHIADNIYAIYDLKWTSEALANILDNAIKYSPSFSSITISSEEYAMFSKITIADKGIGIREAEQNMIFQRFYRSSSVSETTGIGVGLYLSRQIIESQKGYIRVQSELNKGTTFSIFLPKD